MKKYISLILLSFCLSFFSQANPIKRINIINGVGNGVIKLSYNNNNPESISPNSSTPFFIGNGPSDDRNRLTDVHGAFVKSDESSDDSSISLFLNDNTFIGSLKTKKGCEYQDDNGVKYAIFECLGRVEPGSTVFYPIETGYNDLFLGYSINVKKFDSNILSYVIVHTGSVSD